MDLTLERLPRPLRAIVLGFAGWLGVFLAVNLLITLGGVVARWTGKDPQLHSDDWPSIAHLRRVGDRLLVGGQTTLEEYRELADHGVTLVIDARTGSRADLSHDDADELAALGLSYVSLPIPDGRAPTRGQIDLFLRLIDDANGLVFAHCGGGVGRSTSLAATYEASLGHDPSVAEQLAVGPPTIEQIWYVATLQANHPEHHINPVIAVVSRAVDAPRTLYGWVKSWL